MQQQHRPKPTLFDFSPRPTNGSINSAVGPQRRRLLLGASTLAATSAMPAALLAAPAPQAAIERLALLNTHTGEQVDLVLRENGRFVDDALTQVDRVLRDHRSGEVRAIDRTLLQVLIALRDSLGTTQPLHVISGYRSPATNARLAAASGGVARNSLHMQGRAIDIRIPGRELKTVRDAALALRAGGVGYYGRSGFVHLDTGRIRRW